MKALEATIETEVIIEDGSITISQNIGYTKQSITIPVALWGIFVSRVSSEIMANAGSSADKTPVAIKISKSDCMIGGGNAYDNPVMSIPFPSLSSGVDEHA